MALEVKDTKEGMLLAHHVGEDAQLQLTVVRHHQRLILGDIGAECLADLRLREEETKDLISKSNPWRKSLNSGGINL